MLTVERFVNQLMSSNCFIVADEASKHCICIDPASEKSLREIEYIEKNGLLLDYIILTHEHIDHNWGVNALKDKYPHTKLVCSELCDKLVKKTNKIFFSFYNDDPDYVYTIAPADFLIKSNDDILIWNEKVIHFVITPGHSKASMCIDVEGMLFTGDTIMPYPCYLNKKDGDMVEWKKSIKHVKEIYSEETEIYPGHGDMIKLSTWLRNNY